MSRTSHSRYSLFLRVLHWSTLLIIAVTYALAELRGYVPRGTPLRGQMMLWHNTLGLLLLLLVLPRIGARLASPTPPIVPPLSAIVHRFAQLTHLLLYAFLIVQPVLGVVLMQAGERAVGVPFTDLSLPVLIAPDMDLHETAEWLHVWSGKIFYAVIAAHALAALWHHFQRRDNSLRRML